MAGEDPELLAALDEARAQRELARTSLAQLRDDQRQRLAAEEAFALVRGELEAARTREHNLVAAIHRARRDPVVTPPGVRFDAAAEARTSRRGKLARRFFIIAAIGVATTFTQNPGLLVLVLLGVLGASWVLTREVDR